MWAGCVFLAGSAPFVLNAVDENYYSMNSFSIKAFGDIVADCFLLGFHGFAGRLL